MIMLSLILLFVGADFPICTYDNSQDFASVFYANDQYYVFWRDHRYFQPYHSIYGARVTTDGTVLDPDGKLLYKKWTIDEGASIAFDGTNLLAVFRYYC